ncbi:TniB family NTP-binding protein [Sinorhizobium sp. GL28]|uniref:TniB family NTP-binding protein n=1 Tax=Sinorhizobium sp. GL28 TaxID=1358418 RepID=UPI00071C61B1|nr:ATP-binding protein [Sinorhizobium sp. GL28]KSV87550.1 hypothetical protein N184_30820 [Sinorhizobium sp. GL28]
MEMVTSKGQIEALFRSMRIIHSLAEKAFDELDQMRECKRLSEDGEEQLAGTLFADSHAGKSTTMRMYLETRIYPECIARGLFKPGTPMAHVLKLQKLVLFIEIPPETRVKALISAVLKALDDPTPTKGDVDDMIYRAEILLRKHKVELIIFDEVGHLTIPKKAGDQAMRIHNHLKSFLRKGYPVAFVGIKEARAKIFNEKQIERREMNDIEYPELDYSIDADKNTFRDFCADFAISLLEKGITRELSDFIGEKDVILAPLFQASLGLFGGVARIAEKACKLVFDEGAPRIEVRHLEEAVDSLNGFKKGRKGQPKPNAFRDGKACANLVSADAA